LASSFGNIGDLISKHKIFKNQSNMLRSLQFKFSRIIAAFAMFVFMAFANNLKAAVIEIQGEITSNTTWTNNNIYFLKGYVYVTSGNTLTIQRGTIIKGDKGTKGTLIIEQGAKLMAAGDASAPIVFTSNQPKGSRNYGDWGGVIICGKAHTNWVGAKDQQGNVIAAGMAQVEGGPRSLYGGTDDNDNSGVLQYIRIEFAGIAFSPNNEVNGLTLCGVGAGTTVDHIQVSFSGDDSYEWFGGSVNCKYLIAHRGWDDDFDMDCGYNGKLQFLMGMRDCYAADQSGSHGFEIDSYQSGTNTSTPTAPIISNVTISGSLINPSVLNCDPQFVAAVHVRKAAQPKFFNSVFMSYPAGILINNEGTPDSYAGGSLKVDNVLTFKNCMMAGIPQSPFDKNIVYSTNNIRSLTPTTSQGDTITGSPFTNPGPYAWLKTPAYGNAFSSWKSSLATAQTGLRFTNPFNLTNPSFVPTSTSDLVWNGSKSTADDTTISVVLKPDFSDPMLSSSFFTKTLFAGAFGYRGQPTDNWATGWTNFDANSTDYSQPFSVGINETNAGINLNIYPNPSNGNFTVIFNAMHNTEAAISVTDMAGKVVYSTITTGNAGTNSISVDASTLSQGIYMVQIETNEGKAVSKIQVR
jgi:hypothetical protein